MNLAIELATPFAPVRLYLLPRYTLSQVVHVLAEVAEGPPWGLTLCGRRSGERDGVSRVPPLGLELCRRCKRTLAGHERFAT